VALRLVCMDEVVLFVPMRPVGHRVGDHRRACDLWAAHPAAAPRKVSGHAAAHPAEVPRTAFDRVAVRSTALRRRVCGRAAPHVVVQQTASGRVVVRPAVAL